MDTLRHLALEYDSYLQMLRHRFHQIPELRFQTTKTRALIQEYIKTTLREYPHLSSDYQEYDGGIIVKLVFSPGHPFIAFRADFDALAVPEETGLACHSTHQGLSHACGHDIHTAWLLATLKAVVENKKELGVLREKNLLFIFEDGEENPTTPAGAELLLNQGLLKDVAAIYGLHIWANNECTPGMFYSRKGALLGNSGRLGMKLSCQGGHVASPHHGDNALRILSSIQNGIDNFRSTLPPREPITLEPVTVLAGLPDGKSSNIMPASLEAWWGVRTMLPREQHTELLNNLKDRILNVGTNYNAKIEFTTINGHPALINTPEHIDLVQQALGTSQTNIEHEPVLGGESFANYLEHIPGCFWLLAAWQQGSGDHHAPNFNPDTRVFCKGIEYFLKIIAA